MQARAQERLRPRARAHLQSVDFVHEVLRQRARETVAPQQQGFQIGDEAQGVGDATHQAGLLDAQHLHHARTQV